jgi:hypothetical protein
MVVALLQFFIGEATVFATKQQSYLMGSRFLPDSLTALAGINQWPGNSSLPGAGAHHKTTASDGFIHRLNYLGIGQNISRPSSSPYSSWGRIFARLDQIKLGETHIFHSSRCTANIARVGSIDQHYSDFCLTFSGRHNKPLTC